jgi:hypothetical protein
MHGYRYSLRVQPSGCRIVFQRYQDLVGYVPVDLFSSIVSVGISYLALYIHCFHFSKVRLP